MAQSITRERRATGVKTPPHWHEILNIIDASAVYLISEGDKTVMQALSDTRTAFVTVAMPKILPDGLWQVDMVKLSDAVKWNKDGRLEVVGDKIVFRAGDDREIVVGWKTDAIPSSELPDPHTVSKMTSNQTAEATVGAEFLRAVARAGNIIGLKATPSGLKLGFWVNELGRFRGGIVIDGRAYELKGVGTTYTSGEYLEMLVIPSAKTVKLRWGDKSILELSYDVDGISVRGLIAPAIVEEGRDVSWETAPPGEMVGVLSAKEYKLLRGAKNGVLANGVLITELDRIGKIMYCVDTPLKIPGTWKLESMPELDVLYTLGIQPRLFVGDGKLYVEGILVGTRSNADIKCPSVKGPPLPPAIVNAMKNARRVIFEKDGIYVATDISDKEIQIARANLNIRRIEIPRLYLSKLPGNEWRLGATPDGKIIIDAGKEKIIATN